MVERIIDLELKIECLGFRSCEIGKRTPWTSIELCYSFNHCRERDSYKTCRFYKGDKNGTFKK